MRSDAAPHSHDGLEPHVHSHTHSHGGEGGHGHVHSNKSAVLGRLKRARGHLDSVIRMVDSDRDCSEILVQLAAVKSAINNAGKVILQDHITECITEAVFHDDKQKLEDLNKAIAQFMK
jgi:DNA-binding FrmR family transcriptional regulator